MFARRRWAFGREVVGGDRDARADRGRRLGHGAHDGGRIAEEGLQARERNPGGDGDEDRFRNGARPSRATPSSICGFTASTTAAGVAIAAVSVQPAARLQRGARRPDRVRLDDGDLGVAPLAIQPRASAAPCGRRRSEGSRHARRGSRGSPRRSRPRPICRPTGRTGRRRNARRNRSPRAASARTGRRSPAPGHAERHAKAIEDRPVLGGVVEMPEHSAVLSFSSASSTQSSPWRGVGRKSKVAARVSARVPRSAWKARL